MHTNHSRIRAQQRGIPPLIDQIHDAYGRESYDGHGCVVVYLDKTSLRRMEKDMGREPVRCLAAWHDAYKVQRTADGATITIDHRTERQWRR